MTDRSHGPWDAPTEHDDPHDHDSGDMSGDDPPTTRATDHQRARARSAAIANQLASVNGESAAKRSPTLPPPMSHRQPARPAPPADEAIVLLDRVSGRASGRASDRASDRGSGTGSANAALDSAARHSESAAGGIVVVATGGDAERVRKLCHKAGLLVPVMASVAVVHDAMSIVVIGEPSPPAPERVVHVVRPAISDERLVELLRALVSGRVLVEPAHAEDTSNARVVEAARRLASLTDRGAIEMTTIEAITLLTKADRAHCLFHDPATGALWSEARRRNASDDRHAVGGLAGWAAQTGQTVHASPAGDDARWLQEIDDPEGKPQSRLLVQPIIGADRRVHAVLVAVRRWRHTDFNELEVQALASFAALAGPALDLAVAAWPAEPRTPRTTLQGAAARPPLPLSAEPEPVPAPARSSRPSARQPAATPAATPAAPPAAPLEAELARGSVQTKPSPPRPKSSTESTITRELDPRDLAVIASGDDAYRVKRIARKKHLELSTFATIAEAPEFFHVFTIGDVPAGTSDPRVIYAVRSDITDEQLADLLVGLTTSQVVAPVPALVKPNSTAEARRAQVAFAAARRLAAIVDLAAAEQCVIEALDELLDTDRAYCWYVNPYNGALWSETRKRAGGDDRRARAGLSGWAAHTGRGANVPLASADPRWLGPLDDPDGDPHSQLLVQPIVRADQRAYGVLVAVRRARRPGFTDTDAALLARFAALVAPLLEQIGIAHATRLMLGDDTGATGARAQPLPSAGASMQSIVRGTHPHARWLYLVLGAAIAFAAAMLIR